MMKKLFFALLLGLAATFAMAEEGQVAQPCQSEEQARANATEDQLAQQVLCCCRVSGGGSCCGYQTICSGGFVQGCFCTGHSIEGEPVLNDPVGFKVKT